MHGTWPNLEARDRWPHLLVSLETTFKCTCGYLTNSDVTSAKRSFSNRYCSGLRLTNQLPALNQLKPRITVKFFVTVEFALCRDMTHVGKSFYNSTKLICWYFALVSLATFTCALQDSLSFPKMPNINNARLERSKKSVLNCNSRLINKASVRYRAVAQCQVCKTQTVPLKYHRGYYIMFGIWINIPLALCHQGLGVNLPCCRRLAVLHSESNVFAMYDKWDCKCLSDAR